MMDTTLVSRQFNSKKRTLHIDSRRTKVCKVLSRVTNSLLAAGNCFVRAQQLVVIRDDQISPVLTARKLAGLLNQHVEFYVGERGRGEYRPLPSTLGNTWLNHDIERERLPKLVLFSRNPVYTLDWRLTPPGYDRRSGIYYAGPLVPVRHGTTHLDTLLRDFCFRTPGDRTNYIAMLLTALLVPHFMGSKPAVLFNGNQPGLGKSILAQIIAILRDGHVAQTVTYNANDEEFEKRLAAAVLQGATTIIIDNAKVGRRHHAIDSACLERTITDDIMSYRLLGQSAEIRAENSAIIAITANSADVSRDLVTRCAVVNLDFEGDPKRRQFTLQDPEAYAEKFRIEILGELIGLIERWKTAGMPRTNARTRFNKRGWGGILGGVASENGLRDFLENAEEAASLLDATRREFGDLICLLADQPGGAWTATELVSVCLENKLLATDLGEGSPRSLTTRLGTLAGRFVGESFDLADGRRVEFRRAVDRKGNTYRVQPFNTAEP